eukprot:c826_g1_i1.p1 GENE.c826_g1_i1~~c826_g1_i1.p1  ORF type:complete len:148 (-),score=26.36 c826_g1_i1:183-626(-)
MATLCSLVLLLCASLSLAMFTPVPENDNSSSAPVSSTQDQNNQQIAKKLHSSEEATCLTYVCPVLNHRQYGQCSSPSEACADFCRVMSYMLEADEFCFETFHRCEGNPDKFWLPSSSAITSSYESMCQGATKTVILNLTIFDLLTVM